MPTLKEQIEAASYGESGLESYFTTIRDFTGRATPERRMQVLQQYEALIRRGVELEYPSSNPFRPYHPSMSLEEVDELGEDIHVSLVRNPEKQEFVCVNIGFGGGNHASYYFPKGSTEPLLFKIIDHLDYVGLE